MNVDRSRAGLQGVIASMQADEPYSRLYPGVIVNQRGPNSFDFQPDDQTVAGMSGIPIQNPAPGITFTVDTSQTPRALLAFQDNSPAKPVILLWEAPGLDTLNVDAATSISLASPSVGLGQTPTDFVMLGTSYLSALAAFDTAFSTWQTAFTAYIAAIAAIADPSGSATATMSTATAALHTALGLFDSSAQAAISSVSQTE